MKLTGYNRPGKMQKFDVLIEVQQGSKQKYEIDHVSGRLRLDFILSGDWAWPYHYGEILNTLGGDGDALDAVVISGQGLLPGAIVPCRAVGIMKVIDKGQQDDKIICLPDAERELAGIKDIEDLGEEFQKKTLAFLTELANQKQKIMKVDAFLGKEAAEKAVNSARLDKN